MLQQELDVTTRVVTSSSRSNYLQCVLLEDLEFGWSCPGLPTAAHTVIINRVSDFIPKPVGYKHLI